MRETGNSYRISSEEERKEIEWEMRKRIGKRKED